ncbi:transglutaminase-like domain-containing protein [Candidatus Formimonas warabiya]|uniref:Transglutaminase n=1 Tax=Formimonas warabiya TaxID=1761012 RepID=A0A3G1KTP4_FORW1|nr:transglutaminase-like domain-containing protein [Candidatus Formimonas warabiya]ATW25800.1 transglutaminase [Candidatus Formimonas warabiya]
MLNINPITLALVLIAALPVIIGAFKQFTREGVRRSLWSLFDNLLFLAGLFFSIYLTKGVFFDHTSGCFKEIYSLIPPDIQTLLYGQDVLIYIVIVPIILLLISSILRLFQGVFYRSVLCPLSDGLYSLLAAGGQVVKSITGAVIQVPRVAVFVFLAGMALNFFSYYNPSPALSGWMNQSGIYQKLHAEVLSPVLNSNLAKNIPVIINESIADTMKIVIPDDSQGYETDPSLQQPDNGLIIKYFNGVTLDKAVQSNADINQTASVIVGNEKSSTRKAYLIYRWIVGNIDYDYNKAVEVNRGTNQIDSGSIIAFNTRKGICFDYSCLYVSMCRAVGLKVRLVTGLGYNGTAWGGHAWNQVYSSDEGRWINVDTTFGRNGNYFDKPDFIADHRSSEIQGEW